jgi:type IV secretion system protein VirD4
MLSAPTRSGKGVGVVIPNLLNWPDSAVVLDIKGENYDVTAGYRAAHGQAVYAFSPFDESARSHRWNPLTAVRTSPLHRVGDLLTIGQVFFPNDGSGTSSEAFFNDQARNPSSLGLAWSCWKRLSCPAPSANCCASRRAAGSR